MVMLMLMLMAMLMVMTMKIMIMDHLEVGDDDGRDNNAVDGAAFSMQSRHP